MRPEPKDPYEENTDLFQNVELAVFATDLHAKAMNDRDVKEALNSLQRAYTFEQRGKSYRPPKLAGLQLELYEHMRAACEWRLGRASEESLGFVHDHGAFLRTGEGPKTLEDILKVLRRLQSSADFWSKAEGSRGYLNYLHEFFAQMKR
jgi:hypothetical protein